MDVEKLKIGENIADVGGLTLAEDVLEYYIRKNNWDRHTSFQKFYIYFASIFKKVYRKSFLKISKNDPHNHSRFRVNSALAYSNRFKETWGVIPSDKMYSDVVQIW
jgi:predicted metalloendopeptidase